MDMGIDEFIHRFLMHILPSGFMRVRSASLLSGCVKKKNLILIHELLDSPYKESPVKHLKAVDLILFFMAVTLRSAKSAIQSWGNFPV